MNRFKGSGAITLYTISSGSLVCKCSIINEMPSDMFVPNGLTTRTQAAVAIEGILNIK